MTIASARAQAVANILCELKRADKLATLTSIAERAEFSPGSGGRTVTTCLKTVRRDWPHLQWWRAVGDDGILGEEQATHLIEAGYETEPASGDSVSVKSLADHLMAWEEPNEPSEDGDPA